MYENKFFKILCFLIVSSVLFSAFALSSFAAGGNLIVDNMQQWTTITNTYDTAPSIVYSQPLNSITTPSSSIQNELFLKSKSVASANIYAGHTYKLSFDVKGDFSKCKLYIFTCLNGQWNSQNGQGVTELGSVYSNMSNFTTFSASFVPSQLYSSGSVTTIYIGLEFLQQTSGSTTLYIRNISLIDTDDDAGFWSTLWNKLNDILSYLNGVLSNIQDGFSNLASWLTNVKDGIVNGLSTALNNVKTAITNAISGIQQWFVDLGDNISEFFDTLRDYILYFQHPVDLDENGVPVDEYGEPIYENIFDIPDFFETLDDWISDLEQAKSDVESGASAGIQAFENTIVPFTSILNRVPVLTVFITFALSIIVIKKVIG